MPFTTSHITTLITTMFLSTSLLAPASLVTYAYALKMNTLENEATLLQQQQQQHPLSPLASKVIYQPSPSLANIYKELIIASKPLNLRKYNNGLKTKKTKKDSKIYYIPIPPLPYRYIPGFGYDYQPMKINPIMQEAPPAFIAEQPNHFGGGKKVPQNNKKTNVSGDNNSSVTHKHKLNASNSVDSKVYRMDRGNYYFNGQPFRLQVASASAKNNLTPQNLKSKLYFNKKIIF